MVVLPRSRSLDPVCLLWTRRESGHRRQQVLAD